MAYCATQPAGKLDRGNNSAAAAAQKPEAEPFRLLRISLLAYSPVAGEFLVETRRQIEAGWTILGN